MPIEGEARWLDRFELVAELATGGMATVYLARLSGAGGFQRFVGIKRLHPHLAREPEFIEMFLDEARLAARIHHPNVVPILEIGTSDQGYYIVMEYVEGDTLANLIARTVQAGRRVPVHVATRLIIDVLAGLHAAHELADDDGKPLGIVHRDVSPQNILIGIDGSARLTDFGVARATSRLSTTRTGQLKGKLAYMAPEQARGVKDIDRRADLFAAGVVFWEALEGRRLFKGDGEADTLNKVLNEPIPPLHAADPAVPRAIEGVLEKALERERAARFPTAAAFADALERAANEAGEVATHKDVAAYLDDVLGPEILKQRETVRGLIARNEPNRPKSLSMPPPPVVAMPRSLRPLSPEAAEGSGPSVGSAVISNHALPGPAAALAAKASVPPPAPSDRGRAWPWVALVGLAVVAAVGLVRLPGARDESAPTRKADAVSSGLPSSGVRSSGVPGPNAVPPAGLGDVAIPAAAGSAPPAPPEDSAAGASSASGAAGAAPSATARPHAVRPASSTGGPPAPIPDDISRNPYR